MLVRMCRSGTWAGVADAGRKWLVGWKDPPLFNCFSGSGWECFLLREGLTGWTQALCLVQVIRIWLLVISAFTRDEQGC